MRETSPAERWLLRQAIRRGRGDNTIRHLVSAISSAGALVDRTVELAALDIAEGFCPLHGVPLERAGEWGNCRRCCEATGKKTVRYRLGGSHAD